MASQNIVYVHIKRGPGGYFARVKYADAPGSGEKSLPEDVHLSATDMTGARLEASERWGLDSIPGQWGGIWRQTWRPA